MRPINESNKARISNFIDEYYSNNNSVPSVREISLGTGISISTVHRYLCRMKNSGELEYNGRRSITTTRISMEDAHISIAVLGYVSCGPGEEEQERVVEYIRMPTSLIGSGEFFALVAKGESMINAGIFPGDYVIVRKQNSANCGEIVVALHDGNNNLKKLAKTKEGYVLRSCNPNKIQFPDIAVSDLQVQGVAVGVFHRFAYLPI